MIIFLAACNSGNGEQFNPKVEQEKATKVIKSVFILIR